MLTIYIIGDYKSLRNALEPAHVISEGQFEDIAATRTKPPAPGHGAHHASQLGNAGPAWGKTQVLYALGPDGCTIELIQLQHKTGSTS
jgi:hypothetical protein